MQTWKTHFETLANRPNKVTDTRSSLSDNEQMKIIKSFNSRLTAPNPLTSLEVLQAIRRLNKGKAHDESGLSAEHLQHAEYSIADFLTPVFNQILVLGKLPSIFKTGQITPIYKGGDKPRELVDSYRGITVSSIVGKVFERILADHQEALLQQSELQSGFTQGMSPYFASVIKTEAISMKGTPLYVATLDAQKAFDVVDHKKLLTKTFNIGLSGALWMTKQDSYDNMQSCVKWDGDRSQPFRVTQGVKQGGIPSTTDYKTYIDPLLHHLQESSLGLRIGSVYCGAPTVADDVLLMSRCPIQLQTMLHVANDYADRHQYKIHPVKSVITVFGPQTNREYWKDSGLWSINGHALPFSDSSTHLGITRDASTSNPVSTHLAAKISVGRRTLYALVGAGLHGLNGLHPCVSYHIYTIYVLPRMLRGLETTVLRKKDIEDLELFHRSVLRNFQHLPKNVASAAVYTLLGATPMEGILDTRYMTLFGSIARCDGSAAHQLAQEQLVKENLPPQSWFRYLVQLHEKYKLPHPMSLLQCTPTKLQWKHQVQRAVRSYWEEILKNEILTKSSLNHLTSCVLGKAHRLWTTVSYDPRDIRRGCIKAELVCGTYRLQVNRAKYNQYDVNPSCPMCHVADEDRTHFILHCPALENVRSSRLVQLKDLLPREVERQGQLNDALMMKIILSCPQTLDIHGLRLDLDVAGIENSSRSLCYALHYRRAFLMSHRP